MLTNAFAAVLAAAINGAAGLSRAARARKKSAPSAVAAPQGGAAADVLIGETVPWRLDRAAGNPAAASVPVTLSLAARLRQHLIMGSTGTGKTVLLTRLLDADVAAGRGVVLLDARGDLLDRVIERLAARYSPDELRDRLLLYDLRQHAPYQADGGDARSMGFNPLTDSGADPYGSALFTLDAIDTEWPLGVQTSEVVRYAFLALSLASAPDAQYTLLDVERFLGDPLFRTSVLARVRDETVLAYFKTRYESLGDQYVSAACNKISHLTTLPTTRRFVGMRRGGVSLRAFLDRTPDAIVLCCLAADELHSGAGVIGSMLLQAVSKAVMRSDRPASKRKNPTFVYMDEFENFTKSDGQFAEIVSEGRRFGLAVVAAHQSAAQLSPKTRLLARNIMGIQTYFSVGGNDGDTLAGELPSDQPKAALRNLIVSQPVGHALMLVRGKPLLRIRVSYEPDPDVPAAKVAELRRSALERWGRPKAEVDGELSTPPIPVTADTAVPEAMPAAEVREAEEPPKKRGRPSKRGAQAGGAS